MGNSFDEAMASVDTEDSLSEDEDDASISVFKDCLLP